MLVVNASNIQKDFDWIVQNNDFEATVTDVSNNFALLALQGPKSKDILAKVCREDLANLAYYHFIKGDIGELTNVLISATGYTGSGGFELYIAPQDAVQLWNVLMEAGEELGLQAVGLAARDTLRLEMGYCLYGNDIDETTSPLEAGLGWITKFNKDFIGKKILEGQKKAGLRQKLVGFEMVERGIPRKDYPIVDAMGEVIGRVTSGTQSPSLDKAIGLGYIDKKHAKRGSEVWIQIRKKTIKAQVVKVPFLEIG